MIDRLGIDGVLDRYFGKADTFVLISPFDRARVCREPYRRKYPCGRVKLHKLDADNALAMVEMRTKKHLKRVYEKLSDEQKSEIPPFDIVYEQIKAECLEFNEKRKRGDFLVTKEIKIEDVTVQYCSEYSPDFYDLYEKGQVKYAINNDFIRYCYIDISYIFANDNNHFEILQKLMNNTCIRPLDYELRKPPFNELLPHLIKVTPTFTWHCTHSGSLHKEFRFRFNENTKAWLAEHFKFGKMTRADNLSYNDGYKYELEDLAFYDGDKLLFTQCTHEREQYDYLERFD